MISLLAPSKTMTVTYDSLAIPVTEPAFLSEATQIVEAIARQPSLQLFMHISQSLEMTVRQYYDHWGNQLVPAVYGYRGDVYKGFYADTLTKSDLIWANEHVMIMSGLYGVVRLADVLSPYRLEMSAKLEIGKSSRVYDFWGNRLAQYVDEHADGVICMLSSEEYGRPIYRYTDARVVTPVFMDHKPNGMVGQVPIYSKMMRGVMARWVIDNRIDSPDELAAFNGFDYYFDAARSTLNAPVFVRQHMTPLVF